MFRSVDGDSGMFEMALLKITQGAAWEAGSKK
jgi:hypothetical protein